MPEPDDALLKQAWQALGRVLDPEFGLSIVDLGLVYGLTCDAEALHLRMTLTSPHCPLHATILGEVEQALQAISDRPLRLDMVWEPAWTPERISPAGLAQLQE